jgi:geranylgeranyl diphosphate synthase, type I
MMKIPDIRTSIQQEMRDTFPTVEERVAQFYAMQEYHLGWRDSDLHPTASDPGKLLRPQLALLACQTVGGSLPHALPLAAGLQLIHDFSLIHDDIQDNSDTRRGRTTVWKQWGMAHGINVGDGMFVIAHLALHRMTEAGVPAMLALEIIKRFDQTVLTICEGQYLDLSFEGRLDITEADYLAMISRKTAALIAGAAALGGLVGKASPDNARALFDFGQNLGLAFQIQDDILGIWGKPAITGKPYAADLYQRKVSLPIVHALSHADERDDLAALYQQEQLQDAEIDRILTILDTSGSQGYTEGVAAHYHKEALDALARLQPAATPAADQALATMHAMAGQLVGRQA